MTLTVFYVCHLQQGPLKQNSVIAVRSGDESIFWIARCCDDVSEICSRWSGQYYSATKESDGGEDEYSLCSTNDMIWRDVVLADLTHSVRVVGKKLWLPNTIKQLLLTQGLTSTPCPMETPATESDNCEFVDATTLADLRSKTSAARRLVSCTIALVLACVCQC